jgi:lactate racemase-like protein
LTADPVARVPLLSGTRLVVANAGEEDVVLRPPPPGEALADVAAAVRESLRFPLAGPPLEELARGAGRATIVVEPPALPIPGAERDPRRQAIGAAVDELERLGVPSGYQTILVAGGLARRAGPRELAALVTPEFARRFHGHVLVHDVEDPRLVDLGSGLRVHPALVETDLTLVVTAAETVLHGGPGALVAAAGAETIAAAATSASLLETAGSQAWRLGTALEEAVARRVPLVGASLVLNHPRTSGALHGYPYDEAAVERVARSPLRRLFGATPGPLRARILRSLPLDLSAAAAFAGPPSVAHAEALLRGVELRGADLAEPLDALCIGIPRATPYLPRERPNPLLAAHLGLALALRLWRDAFPLVEGGTAILLHRFLRHFTHPTQQPYREFFHAVRTVGGDDAEALERAARAAAADERALEAYRAGRSCHPRAPFADWAACRPALDRLGAVIVAGCRDAVAARQLGFVPAHGLGAALEMATGRAGGPARVGFLLAPPYFPLRVGGA